MTTLICRGPAPRLLRKVDSGFDRATLSDEMTHDRVRQHGTELEGEMPVELRL